MAADPVNFGCIVPVYPLTEGLHQKAMRRVMRQVVDTFLSHVDNTLPSAVLSRFGFMQLQESLRQLHLPPSEVPLHDLNEGRTLAHGRRRGGAAR